MKTNRQQLQSLLNDRVCDIRFVRKSPTPGKPLTRRMLCTSSRNILTSHNGLMVLNYRAPQQQLKFKPSDKNLVNTWDILLQSPRNVNCENVTLVQSWTEQEWWNFFNENVHKMSSKDKEIFMKS